jgi:hypothetical protein
MNKSHRAGISSWNESAFRWCVVVAVLLTILGSLRIVSTYSIFNHTIDEPDHLAAGMQFLCTGKYRYEDQHPPLARLASAIGPYSAGERWNSQTPTYAEGYRILGHGEHYDHILSLGRLGILPFFLIGSAVVFWWGYQIGGTISALTSIALFTTTPPILAHSGLITTDAALMSFVGAATVAAIVWIDRPNPSHSICFGIAIALAVLSKFSAIVFLPAAWLFMCGAHFAADWRNSGGRHFHMISRQKRNAGLILITAALVVWAGYGFSFGPVDYLHCRLPAPRLFTGIHSFWMHNAAGHASYLLGTRSQNGFRYYYPAVLAIKTPLGMLLLLVMAVSLILSAHKGTKALILPLAFSAGILAVAVTSRVNIGVRHILPVYIGISVTCGGLVSAIWQSTGFKAAMAKGGVCLLIAWHVLSGVLLHPDYLAYTNEIARDHPENFVADSDLDWGQDMKRLNTYLLRTGATGVAFAPFNRTYGSSGALTAGDFAIPLSPSVSNHPSKGWNAVSITLWKVFGVTSWPDHTTTQVRIGRSILLWHFPEKQ